jgi:RNA polymerase sigma-70 factor (ECF subfamily)
MNGEELSAMLPHMLPRLWAFALRLSKDRYDAEDLVQRACVRALERAQQLQPDTAPLSWMYSIVHSAWISELRARRVRRVARIDWNDDFMNDLPDPVDKGPEMQLIQTQIIGAVERLPDAQRMVMLLVAVEGLSYQQAADVLGVPIGTVMSRLSRARQAVGAMFGTEGTKTQLPPAKAGGMKLRPPPTKVGEAWGPSLNPS